MLVAEHSGIATVAREAAASPSNTVRQTCTIEDACVRLGIGRTLGYTLARAGRFPVPVIKAGRRYVVSIEALNRALAGEAA